MMISFEEAMARIMAAVRPLCPELVDLDDALGRVIAADVVSDVDMPPFDKSAMDGYACRRADLKLALTVVEEIPAGRLPTKAIGEGECAKIMTGAPLPEGAECVVKVEEAETLVSGLVRFKEASKADNICRRAEDVRRGDVVAFAGSPITPARIGLLAAVGCVRPLVAKRPRIGIMTTGDEVVEPESRPEGAQIRNSNSRQLRAQVMAMLGTPPTYYGIVEDAVPALREAIARAAAENDVIILTGGVSAGDFDFVPGILTELGFDLKLKRVAIQPGRPTVFGDDGTRWCFGLPGNPVAAFVVFELLVKPFLFALMGYRFETRHVPATLTSALPARKAVRQRTIPVAFDGPDRVVPVTYHGSADIRGLAAADALLTVPVGTGTLEEGTAVRVRPL